jgi:hypothetical protein
MPTITDKQEDFKMNRICRQSSQLSVDCRQKEDAAEMHPDFSLPYVQLTQSRQARPDTDSEGGLVFTRTTETTEDRLCQAQQSAGDTNFVNEVKLTTCLRHSHSTSLTSYLNV